jgi:hypothetical protein
MATNSLRAVVLLTVLGLTATPAFAKKSNQAVYEDPFDIAGGGASLTRGTGEGVLFANPAVMPFGEKFHRYLGMQLGVIAGKESVEFVQGMTKKQENENIVDEVFQKPIHAGLLYSLGYITNNVGVAAVARMEPDFEGKEIGSAGTPAINVSAEAYGGGVFGYSARLTRWFSVGATAKYLKVAEPEIEIDLANQQKFKEISEDPAAAAELQGIGTAIGYDVGSLLFLQGRHIDFRLALKVDDVGNTVVSNTDKPFKQMVHVGTGVTFHGTTEALHLALDYRDVLGAYEEKPFKRVYVGSKLLIRNMLGFAAGLYQGYPTFGVKLDLILLRAGVTVYSRELGSTIGLKQRNLYVAYFGLGI